MTIIEYTGLFFAAIALVMFCRIALPDLIDMAKSQGLYKGYLTKENKNDGDNEV